MTVREIRRLARVTIPLPRALLQGEGVEAVRGQVSALMSPASRELDAYLRPAFGWEAALSLSQFGMRGIVAFDRNSKWVWRAWKLLDHGIRQEVDDSRRFVQWAWKIHHDISQRIVRNTLEGALVVAGATHKKVAEQLKLDVRIVEAYETLFWNVIDREQDITYLQALIYPDGKLEEMVSGYFQSANVDQLLKRIGYNSGYEDLAWGAGLRFSPVDSMSIDVAKEQNERLTLSLGALMLRNFGHHAQPHAMVSGSRQLLQAAKIGGVDGNSGGYDDSMSNFMESVLGEDVSHLQERIAQKEGIDRR